MQEGAGEDWPRGHHGQQVQARRQVPEGDLDKTKFQLIPRTLQVLRRGPGPVQQDGQTPVNKCSFIMLCCKKFFVGYSIAMHCHSSSLIRRNVVAVVRLKKKDHLPQKLPDNVFSPTWPQSSMLPCYECVILIESI